MQNKLRPPKVKIDHKTLNRKEVVGIDMDITSMYPNLDILNTVETIANRFIEEQDKFLFKQFERHGYSRDEVISLIDEGRITAEMLYCDTDYLVDGEPIFRIIVLEGINDEQGYGYKYGCIDLKEVKEDD